MEVLGALRCMNNGDFGKKIVNDDIMLDIFARNYDSYVAMTESLPYYMRENYPTYHIYVPKELEFLCPLV